MHRAKLREHCIGFKPLMERHGKWWQVTCPKCGKRVAWLPTENEAKLNWNAQVECYWNMKGHEEEND